jgi:hypothetical protein
MKLSSSKKTRKRFQNPDGNRLLMYQSLISSIIAPDSVRRLLIRDVLPQVDADVC